MPRSTATRWSCAVSSARPTAARPIATRVSGPGGRRRCARPRTGARMQAAGAEQLLERLRQEAAAHVVRRAARRAHARRHAARGAGRPASSRRRRAAGAAASRCRRSRSSRIAARRARACARLRATRAGTGRSTPAPTPSTRRSAQLPPLRGRASRGGRRRHGARARARMASRSHAVPAGRPTRKGCCNCRHSPRLAGQRILIVKGAGGRELLRDAVAAAAPTVRRLELYRRDAATPTARPRRRALHRRAGGKSRLLVVVVTSVEVLAVLLEHVAAADLEPLRSQPLLRAGRARRSGRCAAGLDRTRSSRRQRAEDAAMLAALSPAARPGRAPAA